MEKRCIFVVEFLLQTTFFSKENNTNLGEDSLPLRAHSSEDAELTSDHGDVGEAAQSVRSDHLSASLRENRLKQGRKSTRQGLSTF